MNAPRLRPIRIFFFLVLLLPLTALAYSSPTSSCIANLRQLEGAKATLALEKKLNPGDPVEPNMLSPEYIRDYPRCPGGGHYTLGPVGADPVCSIPDHSLASLREDWKRYERTERDRQARRERVPLWGAVVLVLVPTAYLAVGAAWRRIKRGPEEIPLGQ